MSTTEQKKQTTAEATKKNAEQFEKALNRAKVNYSRRETKAMFNIYANIASVTSKSVRVFLKTEAYEAVKADAEQKSAEAVKAYEEAKKNAENAEENSKEQRRADRAATATARAEAFAMIMRNADSDRVGVHKYAVTITTEQFNSLAEAFKAYADAKQKKSEEQ